MTTPRCRAVARRGLAVLTGRANLAALAGLAVLASGCGDGDTPGTVVASGYVEATEVRIATKVGGAVAWMAVEEGDLVAAGQAVARIDTVDLALQLGAARAERDLAAAELRLRQRGYQEEDIAVARADVDRAEAELAAAQSDLDRFAALLDAGSGTAKTRDDARARRDVAAAATEAGRQRLRKLRGGYRDEEKAAAAARLDATTARIAAIEQQVQDATVSSPTGGVVTERLVEPGEIVAPASPLYVVTDLADAWLAAYVSESQLGLIRLGQQAQVSTDGGASRTGQVAWVSPRAEFTPKNIQTREERVKLVYKIKVRLPNDDGLFKPGMPADARLAAAADGAADRAGLR